MINRLGHIPGRLSSRDRRILVWGTPIILALAFYLILLRPFVDSYGSARIVHEELRSDLGWLLEQRDHLERVNTDCTSGIQPATGAPDSVVEAQSRRLGLRANIRPGATQSEFVVGISQASGNAILALTRELACRGIEVQALEMTRTTADNGAVDARLEVRAL